MAEQPESGSETEATERPAGQRGVVLDFGAFAELLKPHFQEPQVEALSDFMESWTKALSDQPALVIIDALDEWLQSDHTRVLQIGNLGGHGKTRLLFSGHPDADHQQVPSDELVQEIDKTLEKLGAGIERETARMDGVLARLRKTRVAA